MLLLEMFLYGAFLIFVDCRYLVHNSHFKHRVSLPHTLWICAHFYRMPHVGLVVEAWHASIENHIEVLPLSDDDGVGEACVHAPHARRFKLQLQELFLVAVCPYATAHLQLDCLCCCMGSSACAVEDVPNNNNHSCNYNYICTYTCPYN